MNNYEDIPPCPMCGENFNNIFEATDHLLEDDEEVFDPKLILPNGYSLMIGSLLRCFYSYADDPVQIKKMTQSTYATLYAAETSADEMKEFINDIIVDESMSSIDEEIKSLLTEKGLDDE